jgi:hypothetical protein
MTMPEYNFTFRGWKAVAVLTLVVAIFGIRLLWRVQSVDDAGRAALTEWLRNDYQGRGQRDIMQRLQDYKAGLPVQPLPELQPLNIEFSSLSALGTYRKMVVKVQITVDGSPPPQGNSTRYFYMTHYSVGGWSVSSETTSYSYYSVLLP